MIVPVVRGPPQSLQEEHIIRRIQRPLGLLLLGLLLRGLLQEASLSSLTSRPSTSLMSPKTIRDTRPRQLQALRQQLATQHLHQALQQVDLLRVLPTRAVTFRQSM